MLKKPLFILIGVIICLSGLWGGGFLMEQFPRGSGYNFSAFCTGIFIFIIGTGLCIYGIGIEGGKNHAN